MGSPAQRSCGLAERAARRKPRWAPAIINVLRGPGYCSGNRDF